MKFSYTVVSNKIHVIMTAPVETVFNLTKINRQKPKTFI